MQELAPDLVVLRTVFRTLPGKQRLVQREANRRIKLAFEGEGLSMCYRSEHG